MQARAPRVASADDIPMIVDVINRAYVAESHIVHGQRTDQREIELRFAARNTWFLVVDDAPTGPGETRLAASVCLDCDGVRGHIGLLSVHPALQGRGLGALLLRAAEAQCQRAMRCPFVELEVVSARDDLFGFYDRMGYMRAGEAPFPVPHLLKQPAHMVLMRKSFSK